MPAIGKLPISLAGLMTLALLPATLLMPGAASASAASLDVPVVSLASDSADINTSQFIDDTNQAGTDTPESQLLTFAHQLTSPTVITSNAAASSTASQLTLLSAAATPSLAMDPLDDISLRGTSTSRSAASGRTVPFAASNGTLSVQFTTGGAMPVFFTGTEQTTNTDPSNSCSLASVVLTGPVTRAFVTSTGNGCKSARVSQQQWAQSITLPAGNYSLDVDYATNATDDVISNDPASVAGSSTLSLNLSFLPPTAQFTTSLSGTTASFNGAGSLPGLAGRPVTSWRWEFGDGTSAVTSRPQINHIYPGSPLRIPTYRVTLQVTDAANALGPSTAHNVLGTALTLAVGKTLSRLHVGGLVRPDRHSRAVVVTLSRQRSGTFRVLQSHRPLLSSHSRYATAFPRPAAGTCRLTARYPGDATHLASTSRRTFPC